MDALASVVGYLLIDIVVVTAGRLVLAVLTLGRWRGEALDGQEARIHSAAGALSFVRDGQRVLTRNGLALLGLAALFAGFAAMVAW